MNLRNRTRKNDREPLRGSRGQLSLDRPKLQRTSGRVFDDSSRQSDFKAVSVAAAIAGTSIIATTIAMALRIARA